MNPDMLKELEISSKLSDKSGKKTGEKTAPREEFGDWWVGECKYREKAHRSSSLRGSDPKEGEFNEDRSGWLCYKWAGQHFFGMD